MPRGNTVLIATLIVLIVLVGGAALYLVTRTPATNANVNAGAVTTNAAITNTVSAPNANEDASLGVTPAPTTINSSGDLTNAETALNANLDADGGDADQLNGLTNGF